MVASILVPIAIYVGTALFNGGTPPGHRPPLIVVVSLNLGPFLFLVAGLVTAASVIAGWFWRGRDLS
jgi:hypothetical protein